MIILSPDQIRNAEAKADASGIPFRQMMETAGVSCADYILRRYANACKIVILVGKGKNGGDGYVCARRLADYRKEVTVIRLFQENSDPLSEQMRDLLPTAVRVIGFESEQRDARLAMQAADLIVDAVFGIGFKGRFPSAVRDCISFANALNKTRIAIDLPSGVGERSEEDAPFQAHVTLSMLCLKKEQIYAPYRSFCGQTEVIPIGIPCEEPAALHALTHSEAASLLPARPFDAHKGTFGNVLIFGGCRRMPGAPLLAAKGALSSGAGLVTLAVPESNLPIAAVSEPECVFRPLPTDADGYIAKTACSVFEENKSLYSAVVLGNGMGQTEDVRRIVEQILLTAECPVVLDADGIIAVSDNINILKAANAPVLLTPHPGEMSRLTGRSIAEINAERERITRAFAVQYGVYVLLKGANTVVADPQGNIYINGTGCSALARGGSGDVLAGIIGALLAQNMRPADALILAAYVHGRAGELTQARCSSYGATTKENIAGIASAFLELTESK